MKKMLMLNGKGHVAFEELGANGETTLMWLRKELPEYFKHARITETLQVYSDKVIYGHVYEKGWRDLNNAKALIFYGDGSVYDIQKRQWVRGGESGKDAI